MDFIHSLTYHTVSQSTPSTTSRIMVHALYPAFTPFLTRPFFPPSPVTSSVASTNTWPSIHPTITSRRKTIPRCSSPQVGQHENDANTHPCHAMSFSSLSYLFVGLLFFLHMLLYHTTSPLSSNLYVHNYLVPASAPVRSERSSRGVLGARQVGGKAAGDEDR